MKKQPKFEKGDVVYDKNGELFIYHETVKSYLFGTLHVLLGENIRRYTSKERQLTLISKGDFK